MFDPAKVLYQYESVPGYFLIFCITMVTITAVTIPALFSICVG